MEDASLNPVPQIRITKATQHSLRKDGDYILYWMSTYRRTGWNFSMQRAVEWANELQKPLVVLEILFCTTPWASDRFHKFILEGMASNFGSFRKTSVVHYPFVEKEAGQGKALLANLARNASIVITDDYPTHDPVQMIRDAIQEMNLLVEKVDSNGLLPLRITDRLFKTAQSFRRFIQSALPEHLQHFPAPNSLENLAVPAFNSVLSADIMKKWPPASAHMLQGEEPLPAALPIDHHVHGTSTQGGSEAGESRLRHFIRSLMSQYAEKRNHPDEDGTSGLSPYLHFGHISAHQVVSEVFSHENWTPELLGSKALGQREGWWGMTGSTEAFLDELITWREIGFNCCFLEKDHDKFQSLPQWAQTELLEHAADPRPYVYTLEQFESASTHDRLWNAAQTQLVVEGGMHNYLRMLWGKKILQWTKHPEDALHIMIHLNNKYALDGSDPNSYTGIFWVLGRYDRPWGPVRPIFGKIRYMSSKNTLRKVKAQDYLSRFGSPEA